MLKPETVIISSFVITLPFSDSGILPCRIPNEFSSSPRKTSETFRILTNAVVVEASISFLKASAQFFDLNTEPAGR